MTTAKAKEHLRQEKIVHYLISAKNGCSITELMKLAYLLDVGFQKIKGSTFTNFQFIRYFYGPFTREIYDIVSKLLTSDHLSLEESLAIDGKSIYKARKAMSYDCFSKEEIELMNQLLQEIITMSATQLTHLAYKTEPMKALGATLGGSENLNIELDFNKIRTLAA